LFTVSGVSKSTTREPIQSSVIVALRKRREKLGMSMNVLAQKSGLSLTMISFLERELRKPTLDTLLRIAEALEVDLWKVLKQATERTKRT